MLCICLWIYWTLWMQFSSYNNKNMSDCLSWMLKDSYSNVVKVFLHVIVARTMQIQCGPHLSPGRSAQKPRWDQKWTPWSLSVSDLSCLFTVMTSSLKDMSERPMVDVQVVALWYMITVGIPTPSLRYSAYDKMSVVTFRGSAWHKSFSPNWMKHKVGGLRKFRNSVDRESRSKVRPPFAWKYTNVLLYKHLSPLSGRSLPRGN